MKTNRLLMILLIFTGVHCVAVTTLIAADSSSDSVEHFKVKRLNDLSIDAYLKRPKQMEGKVGILLMLQGSGCLSARDRMFAWEAQWNNKGRNKVAVLVTEKVGVSANANSDTCSSVYRQHHSFEQRVYDYNRVIQHLRNTATWWNGKLYILGGSEGGGLAAVLAAFIPETEKVVILAAGGGMNMAESIVHGVTSSMLKSGASESEVQAVRQQLEDKFKEIRNNPTPNLVLGSDPSLGTVYQETYKFYASILAVRPLNALVDVNVPIYMAHGTEDYNDPLDSVYLSIDKFKALGKTNLYYREYAGLDHSFKDQAGVSKQAEVVTAAFDWLFDKLE